MGITLMGLRPSNDKGEELSFGWGSWVSMIRYCERVAPHTMGHCTHWGTNDGDGLNVRHSRRLANLITMRIDNGTAKTYTKELRKILDGLESVECMFCEGTGTRTRPIPNRPNGLEWSHKKLCPTVDDDGKPHPRAGQPGWCNGCNGIGHHPDDRTYNWFDLEILTGFRDFLKNCGGFQIW